MASERLFRDRIFYPLYDMNSAELLPLSTQPLYADSYALHISDLDFKGKPITRSLSGDINVRLPRTLKRVTDAEYRWTEINYATSGVGDSNIGPGL